MNARFAIACFLGLALNACEAVDGELLDEKTASQSIETSTLQKKKAALPAQPMQSRSHRPVLLPHIDITQMGAATRVFVDEGHHNYHTLTGTYASFGEVLKEDGYQVSGLDAEFSSTSLEPADILVIANAQNEANVDDWSLPVYSAFSDDEIAAVEQWVKDGGALFLIADHMPMSGAAAELGRVFGFELYDGFAVSGETLGCAAFTFATGNGLLVESAVTRGRNENEKVDQVLSFCGQGFGLPPEAQPVLLLDPSAKVVLPEESWTWDAQTPFVSGEGLAQGAVINYGQGRVAVFGEAQIFTCKAEGKGMCRPDAEQNKQFLLNVVHWLDEQTDLAEPAPVQARRIAASR